MADWESPTHPAAGLRIGELSRRVGVSDHVLRAWERRYGLLRPRRSSGGFRLYSAADERRVRRMHEHLSRGLAAAEAARQALADDEADWSDNSAPSYAGEGRLTGQLERLQTALDGYDESTAQAVLDGLLDEFTVETVLGEVLLPFLRELGERWSRGEASVAQEHFASGLLRARLVSLTRGWGLGGGPAALLACAPGELHDLPLLMFGICLRRQGWRITYLGADTPLTEVAAAAQEVQPQLVVLATAVAPAAEMEEGLPSLATHWPVALAGRGADHELAASAGVEVLIGDPVNAAFEVASRVHRAR